MEYSKEVQFLCNFPYYNPTTYTRCESLRKIRFPTASHHTIINKRSTHQILVVGTIFNLAKVNTVPCMFTAAFSLGQQVDDWIV